jgi:hypothetical protein
LDLVGESFCYINKTSATRAVVSMEVRSPKPCTRIEMGVSILRQDLQILKLSLGAYNLICLDEYLKA